MGDLAESYIGKHLLVGITYLNGDESVDQRVELHGIVVGIDSKAVTLKLHDTDREFTLPPDLAAIQPAQPGEYRLRTTGEVVVDPDLLATWTVYPPHKSRRKARK